jgi:hypothetical protein
MIPLDYVLAVALLAAPDSDEFRRGHGRGDSGLVQPGEGLAFLAPTVQTLALHWELMDSREVGFLMARPEDFAADLPILRRRYGELAEAPPLSDCLRFPDRRLAAELLEFNRAYRQHLVRRESVEVTGRAELDTAIAETDALYGVWDAVRDAGSEGYNITVRRQALLSLRNAIGPEAYFTGRLPPHVPVWRFRRVD